MVSDSALRTMMSAVKAERRGGPSLTVACGWHAAGMGLAWGWHGVASEVSKFPLLMMNSAPCVYDKAYDKDSRCVIEGEASVIGHPLP